MGESKEVPKRMGTSDQNTSEASFSADGNMAEWLLGALSLFIACETHASWDCSVTPSVMSLLLCNR